MSMLTALKSSRGKDSCYLLNVEVAPDTGTLPTRLSAHGKDLDQTTVLLKFAMGRSKDQEDSEDTMDTSG